MCRVRVFVHAGGLGPCHWRSRVPVKDCSAVCQTPPYRHEPPWRPAYRTLFAQWHRRRRVMHESCIHTSTHCRPANQARHCTGERWCVHALRSLTHCRRALPPHGKRRIPTHMCLSVVMCCRRGSALTRWHAFFDLPANIASNTTFKIAVSNGLSGFVPLCTFIDTNTPCLASHVDLIRALYVLYGLSIYI